MRCAKRHDYRFATSSTTEYVTLLPSLRPTTSHYVPLRATMFHHVPLRALASHYTVTQRNVSLHARDHPIEHRVLTSSALSRPLLLFLRSESLKMYLMM